MKKVYMFVWAVFMCCLPLMAQKSVPSAHKVFSLYGKTQDDLPDRPRIKPQDPKKLIRNKSVGFNNFSGSLLRTAQSLRLDSVIREYDYNHYKDVYSYDNGGNITQILSYYKSGAEWLLSGRTQMVYDGVGNMIKETYENHDGNDFILSSIRKFTYNPNKVIIKDEFEQYNAGVLYLVSVSEYNDSGSQIKNEAKELKDGQLVVIWRDLYEYNSKGKQIRVEYQVLDETTGALRTNSLWEYDYDSSDRQTLSKYSEWDGNQLRLDYSYQYAYDNRGNRILYDKIEWNGSIYITNWTKRSYNSEGWLISYENMYNDDITYQHSISNYLFSDKYHAVNNSVDTFYWKEDGSLSINVRSNDVVYDNDGNCLSEKSFVADAETWERLAIEQMLVNTYDAQGRQISQLITYYNNGEIGSVSKHEWAYDGKSYIYTISDQDLVTQEWSVWHRQKYEYVQLDDKSYYYRYYDWNETSQDWIVDSGYKYEYKGNDSSYTRIDSDWSTEENDWVITYGFISVDEQDGDNYLYYTASWNTETKAWNVGYSKKTELVSFDGKVKVLSHSKLEEGSLDKWIFDYTERCYYSEFSTANEEMNASIGSTVYAYGNSIHIESLLPTNVSVYGMNGKCYYSGMLNGQIDVNNLKSGVYIVLLKADSGVERVKVMVK